MWFEYVRSKPKANIADLPSRGVDTPDMLIALGSTYVEMVMPPLEDWKKPAARWAAFTQEGANKKKEAQIEEGLGLWEPPVCSLPKTHSICMSSICMKCDVDTARERTYLDER